MSTYDDKDIKTFSNIEGIRQVPAMYIGDLSNGLIHLLNEIISNSVDECIMGRGNTVFIDIGYENDTLFFKVIDKGAGIPLQKVVDVATKTHSSGKFDPSGNSSYKFSGGLHGVGLTITNALSKKCIIISKRNHKQRTVVFEYGVLKSDNFIDIKENESGTTIYWEPDEKIFTNFMDIDSNFIEIITNMVKYKASINNNIHFHINIMGKSYKFYYNDGNEAFFLRFVMENGIKIMKIPLITISNATNKFEAHGVIGFALNTDMQNSLQFVNGIQNHNIESLHIKGMSDGCLETIIKHIGDVRGVTISKGIIRELFTAILITKDISPEFSSQTKERYSNKEYYNYIKGITSFETKEWILKNPNDYEKLKKNIIALAKSKENAKKNKEVSINTSNSTIWSNEGMSKYNGCMKYGENSTLFLVEGDSAGGYIRKAANTKNQAVLKLQGKIPNQLKKSNLDNNILLTLVNIMGCGIGNKYNINKIKFGKIVIACDADDDGLHIRSLLLTFFYKYYPDLIKKGYIFLANPPLYCINIKGKNVFINNEKMYKNTIINLMMKNFAIINLKTRKELPKTISKTYLYKIFEYAEFLDNFSSLWVLDPILLETIVLHYNNILIDNNLKEIIKLGYYVKIIEQTESRFIMEFNKGILHSNLIIDNNFYNKVALPLYIKLMDIRLLNIGLIFKNNNKLFANNAYLASKLMNSLLLNKYTKIKRFKGLGEMNIDEIYDSIVGPNSVWTKITLEYIENSSYLIDIFMGNNIEEKKKKLLNDISIKKE